MTKEEAHAERDRQDEAFKFSEEPQTLTCDDCHRTGNAHCFGRFSFWDQYPTFLCVDCILGRAQQVVDHCKEKLIGIHYAGERFSTKGER